MCCLLCVACSSLKASTLLVRMLLPWEWMLVKGEVELLDWRDVCADVGVFTTMQQSRCDVVGVSVLLVIVDCVIRFEVRGTCVCDIVYLVDNGVVNVVV